VDCTCNAEADINQPTVDVVKANPGVNLNALRPYAGYGSIRQTDNVASSRYNSLQIALNRRFANGFMFGMSYTLSKSYDDGSNQRDVIPDTYNAHFLWGPSEFDNRHTLVFNYMYNLPFFNKSAGLTGRLLGGWQIAGVAQFQTGTPCSIAAWQRLRRCRTGRQLWMRHQRTILGGERNADGDWPVFGARHGRFAAMVCHQES